MQSKEKIQLADIFEGTETAAEKRRIRLLLFQGICSECGGKLRYRPSFDVDDWVVTFLSGLTLRICICKSCGNKKKLVYLED